MSIPTVSFVEQLALSNGGLTTDLNGGKLHLFTAVSPSISPASAVADFTEAAYAGYAAATIATWSGGFRDANGRAVIAMPSHLFNGPGGGGGPTILGAYYTDSTSAVLLWAAEFDTPAPLVDNLAALVVSAQIGPDGSGWISIEGSTLP